MYFLFSMISSVANSVGFSLKRIFAYIYVNRSVSRKKPSLQTFDKQKGALWKTK